MSDLVYLAHHGIKGQKHGVRKYQNPDGSLTPLGRIHYGVGAAKNAIRKKIAPTNAELNAQIRKQKSKNLNKQKRRELRDLKRGVDKDASSPSESKLKGQHKKFAEMSDAEIEQRIKRLSNEVKLAELETTKSLTPGKRFMYDIAKDVGKKTITNILTDTLTESGKKALKDAFDSTKKSEDRKKGYETELAERKAKEELSTYKKEHPEGLSRFSPSAKKAKKEREQKEIAEKSREKLEADAKAAQNRMTIQKERDEAAKRSDDFVKKIEDRQEKAEKRTRDAEASIEAQRARQARGLQQTGHTNAEIAKMMGLPDWEVGYLLYEKPKKK